MGAFRFDSAPRASMEGAPTFGDIATDDDFSSVAECVRQARADAEEFGSLRSVWERDGAGWLYLRIVKPTAWVKGSLPYRRGVNGALQRNSKRADARLRARHLLEEEDAEREARLDSYSHGRFCCCHYCEERAIAVAESKRDELRDEAAWRRVG